MTDDLTSPAGAPGYTDALAELESILVELEDGEVDIDRLAERVKRAAELLELCRGHVEAARVEVTRIVAELATTGDADHADDGVADDVADDPPR